MAGHDIVVTIVNHCCLLAGRYVEMLERMTKSEVNVAKFDLQLSEHNPRFMWAAGRAHSRVVS